jgi:RNA polymerase sigma factor (TIGR02999 family)
LRPAWEVEAAFVSLYDQIRGIARARLAGVDGGSLQATALAHEALIRLSGRTAESFTDEQHVLAAVSQAIRSVIVDHLRSRRAAKRNGGATRPLSDFSPEIAGMLEACDDDRAGLALDIDAALEELSEISPETRVIVELHVFGGIPLVEVGALTGQSERTVRRRWAFATAVLRERLEGWVREDPGSPGRDRDDPGR